MTLHAMVKGLSEDHTVLINGKAHKVWLSLRGVAKMEIIGNRTACPVSIVDDHGNTWEISNTQPLPYVDIGVYELVSE